MLNETRTINTEHTITLQFQTPQQLAAFRKTVAKHVKTDIVNLILICDCSETDLELAIKNFGATVINKGS